VLAGGAIPDALTKDFFAATSAMTGGQCLQRVDAALLGEAILSGAREGVDMEGSMVAVRGALDAAAAAAGRALTSDEAAAETKRVLAASGSKKARALPQEKVLKVTPARLEQARSASTIVELRRLWTCKAPSSSSPAAAGAAAAAAAPVVSAEDAIAARMTSMATARSARSVEAVMVECVAEGSKVRARVISSGYDSSKNCQFPRDIREAGKKFWVQTIVDAGSFYRAKGTITAV
jgi:hypothetical protein